MNSGAKVQPPGNLPRDLRLTRFTGTDGRRYAVLSFSQRSPSAKTLTRAEQEVVSMLMAGFSNTEIAKTRRVTNATVATQVRRVFARFDVSSRAELVGRVTDPGRPTPRRRPSRHR